MSAAKPLIEVKNLKKSISENRIIFLSVIRTLLRQSMV